ncbi:glycoside hydrolase [Amanita rubescens]|nr:glycoside hydrolase [Amanita rubescens]
MSRRLIRLIPWIVASLFFFWLFTVLLAPDFVPRHWIRPFRYPNKSSNRAENVRNAFLHAYRGYRDHAFPSDELLPVSGSGVNNFNGWGLTLFDSLDTMWLMDLHGAFNEAVGFVADSTFELEETEFAPFFETVIRYLGGLLSAYALSGEPIFLTRADDLGNMLLPAFNTTSGMPMFAVNTVSGHTKFGWTSNVLWSEIISNQMEYKYILRQFMDRLLLYLQTETVMQHMYKANITGGLFPTMWDVQNGLPVNHHYAVGAYADSAHEYLLKQWLLTGQTEPKAKDLYLQSVEGILTNLTYISPTRHLLYVTDMNNGVVSHKFEHLTCFLTWLACSRGELHMWAAQGLAYTCYIMYADHATGLSPDEVSMDTWSPVKDEGRWLTQLEEWRAQEPPSGLPPGLEEVPANATDRDYRSLKDSYLLRPETVESIYILWKLTGQEKWRDRGWEIFQAIENHTRTEYGYSSVSMLDSIPAHQKDEMPSFFLAETLKYLYLLFLDKDVLPLDDWVFNTEAHPFPIFHWSTWEEERYGIAR